METQPLLNDEHLMRMFNRLSDREIIPITVWTVIKPTELYKFILNFRRSKEQNSSVDGGHQVVGGLVNKWRRGLLVNN